MKKKTIFVTFAAMLFTTIGLASCGQFEHKHTYVEHAAVNPTCQSKGNELYYTCSGEGCSKIFDSSKKEISAIPELPVRAHVAADLTNHAAVAGTDCQHKGTIEYWTCNTCSKKFSDGQGQHEITSIEGNYGPHTYVEHAAVAPTCQAKGNELYYTCSVEGCTKIFDSSKKEISAIPELPIRAHVAEDLEAHAAVAGKDCQTKGTGAYWTCNTCSKMFSDADGKTEITSIPEGEYGAHTLTEHAAVPAKDCTEEGTIQYWSCSVCKNNYSDATGTQKVTDLSDHTKGPHTMTKHDAVAATCEADGNKEYWSCSKCSKYFLDDKGVTETTLADVTLGKLGHAMSSTWSSDETNHWHKCTREGCTHIEDEAKHTFGDWIVDKEANYPDKGSKHRICSACEYREDEDIEPVLTAAMVMESIDNIPETADYKGVYNGLVDPFTERADELYNAYIEKGGSASDITNLAKLTSTKDSLSMYVVSADKKIDASVFSPGSSVKDPVKDYVNSGYKFVTKVDIGQYVSICSFDKAKAATFKDQLTGATSISFALKVSKDIKIQPQISYDDGAGGTAYKGPSGVTETKAGEWLFLTLDSTWVNLLVSDSFKLFYISAAYGQTTVEAGLEVTIANMYIDKTVTPSASVSKDWTQGTDQTLVAKTTSGTTDGYDAGLFTYIQSPGNVALPFYDCDSSTIQLKANDDITSGTNIYFRPGNASGKIRRFAFYVNGQMTVSKVEFVKGNSIDTSAKETLVSETVTYTTGWHYVDTIGASTQYYGYFIFSVSSMTQNSSILIGRYASLTKTA